MLESTVLAPFVNPDRGRDHGPGCWSLVAGGGGIKAGQAAGASDAGRAKPAKEHDTQAGRPIQSANSLDDTTVELIPELL